MDGADSTLVPGYRLDRYELLCPIASGGMASVWLARLRGKRGFEKLFAIKTIRTELISDPHFQEMFLDEARIASRIIHPNVAQILELGEQDDILYIVMEYVDGDSLAKINRLALKGGAPLPPGISMRIIADMCAGLHAAHMLKDASGESLGVVHRDVSPQNILVTTEGTSKVIDFGLVKARNRSAGETGQGVVKGKIRYMAPEQVASRGIDHRADVWAAGMCLYELLVGHVPYHTEDDIDIVKRLMSHDPLPPFDVAFPPQIERVLARALVKDLGSRFESCAQMKRAIETAIHELDLPAENEHVAEFLAQNLPDLASKRSATIARATQASQSRHTPSDSFEGLGPGDIAFAATEVSGRRRDTSDPDLPLTRRLGPQESDAERNVSSYGASRTTSATSLRDQLGERKKRSGVGLFIAAGVVLGAGAWILWPRPETVPVTPNGPAAAASLTNDAGTAPAASTVPAAVDPWSLPSATLELGPSGDIDAGVSRTVPVRPKRPPLEPSPYPPPATAPPARTYNPAWSILTNPPEAGLVPPPPASTQAPPPPAPPPPPPAEEPK